MLINLLRVKIVAVLLGPYGVGVTSQLTTLINTLTVFMFLGLGPGVAKFLAEANAQGDRGRARQVVATSTLTLLIVSGLGTLACLIAVRPITGWTLQDLSLQLLVIISLIGVPLAVFSNLGRAFLQGYKEVRAIAVTNVGSTALSFVTVVPLVYYWGVTGAAVNLALTWGFNAAFYWFFFRRNEASWWRILTAFDSSVLRQLVRYGAASLTVGAATWLNALAIRSLIIAHLGADRNGLYQAVYGLSVQYMTLVTGAMGTYSFAHLAEIEDRREVVVEINNNLRLVLLILTPVLAGVVLLRELGLLIFYSPSFLAASGLFPLQALGDFCMACAWAFGLALLPLGQVRPWLLLNLIPVGAFFALAALLLPIIGLPGVVLAYAAGQAGQAVLSWWQLRRTIQFGFVGRNAGLLVRSLILLSLLALIPAASPWRYPAGAGLLLLWACFALTPAEYRRFWEEARGRVKQICRQWRSSREVI